MKRISLLERVHWFDRPPVFWVKALIILGVLLFSALLAFSPEMSFMIIPGVIVAGVAILIIFIQKPEWSLVLLVVGSLIIPSPLAVIGQQNTLNTAVLMIAGISGLSVVDMFIRQRRLQLEPTRTLTPLMAFLVVVLISFVSGQVRYYYQVNSAPLDAQIAGVAVFFLCAAAYLILGNMVADLKWIERISWLFIIFGMLYVLGRFNYRLESLVRPFYQPGSDASMFWLWMVTITSSQAFFNKNIHMRWRVVMMLMLAATLYISLVQGYSWKSGWIPAMASLAVIMFIGAPKLRIPAVLLGIITVALNFIDFGASLAGGEDYSLLTRVEAWRIIIEIAKANPIFGLGPSNYYWYTPLIPILGYSVSFNSHNNYIDLFAQTGIVGVIFFAWFIGVLGSLIWRLVWIVPEGFPRAYAIGLCGAFVGMLVSGVLGDWFFPFVYNVGLVSMRSTGLGWLFLGGVVVLEKLYLPAKRNGT